VDEPMKNPPHFMPNLSDRITELLRAVEYSTAHNAEEKQEVYRLRYNCYLREGAISPRHDSLLTDEFDEYDHTHIFVLKIDEVIVASIRLHILKGDGVDSPTMRAFGDMLSPYIKAGQTLVDPTRFVVNTEAARRFPDLMYHTLRLPFMAAAHFSAETALAAVRKEHMPFYKRVLRYSKISEPREYPQLVKPLGLMVANYPEERESVLKRYPFFAPLPNEIEKIFGMKSPLSKTRVIEKPLCDTSAPPKTR